MRPTALAILFGLGFAVVVGVSPAQPAQPPKKNPFRDGSGKATEPVAPKAPVNLDPKEAPKVRLASVAGVGRFVPDVVFTDLAGKSGKLSDFKGSKFTVVAFTNTTCPICKKYTPTLQRLEKEFAAKGVS
ncbi:MAG: redoxin domain-containing protein, partial [Planctomycetia bacterium]|nr:redoxin domain-containing protein [Planctomycetia bacterium]